MRRNKRWLLGFGLAGLLAFTGTAQAALMDLGDGTVKDGTNNLIWLQNWNVNGLADWSTQMSWAAGLDFGGSTEWRLPSVDEYLSICNAVGSLCTGWPGPFVGVAASYWTGTEFEPDTNQAYVVLSGTSQVANANKNLTFFSAVAVRPSDVAAVPEPGTLALFGMGLLGLLGLGRAGRPLRLRFFD